MRFIQLTRVDKLNENYERPILINPKSISYLTTYRNSCKIKTTTGQDLYLKESYEKVFNIIKSINE